MPTLNRTYPSKGRAANVVIAASNSSDVAKSSADYICTGTADEATINAALLVASVRGGAVLCLAGTYNLAATVMQKYSDVTLSGEALPGSGGFVGSWDGTTKVMAAPTKGTIFKAASTGFNLITIGSDQNIPDGGENRHRGWKIQNIFFQGAGGAATWTDTGIYGTTGNDDNCVIQNCYFNNLAAGINVCLDSGLIFNNVCQNIGGDCITASGVHNRIQSNMCWDSGGNGIVVQFVNVGGIASSYGFVISGNTIGRMLPTAGVNKPFVTSGAGVYLKSTTNDCTVIGNEIADSQKGVMTDGGSGHNIVGNKMRECNLGGILIGVATATTDTSITGNHIKLAGAGAAGVFGVSFWSGSTTNFCTGNFLKNYNNAGASQIFSGTGNTISNNKNDDGTTVQGTGPYTITSGTYIYWVDANDTNLKGAGAGTYTDGASAVACRDQSGSGGSLVTFGTAPLWKSTSTIVAGKAGLRFNGTTMALKDANFPKFKDCPVTIFAVIKATLQDAANHVIVYDLATHGLLYFATAMIARDGSDISVNTTPLNAHVVQAQMLGTASSTVSVDADAGTTGSNGSAGFGTGGGLVLGARQDGAADWFAGDIGEIIILQGQLSSADRSTIRTGLESKWTIAGS